MMIFLSIILAIVAVKCVWTAYFLRHTGDVETEKIDILERSRYLRDRLLVLPKEVIDAMPAAVRPQFQGEWALYSCSMYCAALVNICSFLQVAIQIDLNT